MKKLRAKQRGLPSSDRGQVPAPPLFCPFILKSNRVFGLGFSAFRGPGANHCLGATALVGPKGALGPSNPVVAHKRANGA